MMIFWYAMFGYSLESLRIVSVFKLPFKSVQHFPCTQHRDLLHAQQRNEVKAAP